MADGLLAPRFNGQHLKIQLHDEDPGVGCLRIDAPVGADLSHHHSFQTHTAWEPTVMKNSGSNYERPLPAWRDRLPICSGGVQQQEAKTSLQTTWNAISVTSFVHSKDEPAHLDARFNQVVQCLDEKNQTAVRERLRNKRTDPQR